MRKYFDLLKNYKLSFLLINFLKEICRRIWQEGIRGSYSQNGEDLIINKLINKQIGTYLEIGGYHPSRLSNSYFFYKKGWSGTIIEPNPEVKKLFQKQRPRDNFLNIGIADREGQMEYFSFLIPAINTFNKKEALKRIREGHKLINKVTLKVKKVSKVVDRNYDLLSLDTEGFDQIILENWPWKICKPKVICVEDKKIKINGYKLIRKTKDNLIFLLEN